MGSVALVDVVDAATRSRMMSAIKGKHTKPEIVVRQFLHARGYRFRLHRNDLPGRPDIVLPKLKIAIFVHGCFWHRHEGCFYATFPSTRVEFWRDKLTKNTERDLLHVMSLRNMGWRVLTVWECGLKQSLEDLGRILVFFETDETEMNWPVAPPRKRDFSCPNSTAV